MLPALADALEDADEPARNVAHVGGARLHIFVPLHREEHPGEHVRRLLHGKLRAVTCADAVLYAVAEIGVVEHHAVDIEHLSGCLICLHRHVIERVELGKCALRSALVSFALSVRLIAGGAVNGQVGRTEPEKLCDCCARRSGYSLKHNIYLLWHMWVSFTLYGYYSKVNDRISISKPTIVKN